MYKINNNRISLTRGDSAEVELVITDEDGREYTPQIGDQILFTVKADTRTKNVLFQKAFSDGYITINPADTEDLEYGKYVYDVQLKMATGEVTTIITPSTFKVLEEVTF